MEHLVGRAIYSLDLEEGSQRFSKSIHDITLGFINHHAVTKSQCNPLDLLLCSSVLYCGAITTSQYTKNTVCGLSWPEENFDATDHEFSRAREEHPEPTDNEAGTS